MTAGDAVPGPRLHVLLLIDTLSVGGAQQLLLTLAGRLDPTRFSATVLCLSGHHPNRLLGEFERRGHAAASLGMRNRYDPRGAVRLHRFVGRRGVDLIHTHLADADILGRLVGRIAGVPVISTLHNVAAARDDERVDRRLLRRWTASRLTSHFVAVSAALADDHRRAWSIAPERITTIANAVPLEPFLPIPADQPQPSPDGLRVLTVGRLHEQKGHRYLLDATRRVLDAGRGITVRIAGSGALDSDLRAQADQLGIADRVEFLGRRSDVPELLADTDVVAMPSLWEGMPLAAIEAMAAARAVVLTPVGGNRELVDHDVDGLLVPPRDAAALAQALLMLADDPERRRRLGVAARQRMVDQHSIERFVRAHERLYAAAVGRRRGRLSPSTAR